MELRAVPSANSSLTLPVETSDCALDEIGSLAVRVQQPLQARQLNAQNEKLASFDTVRVRVNLQPVHVADNVMQRWNWMSNRWCSGSFPAEHSRASRDHQTRGLAWKSAAAFSLNPAGPLNTLLTRPAARRRLDRYLYVLASPCSV